MGARKDLGKETRFGLSSCAAERRGKLGREGEKEGEDAWEGATNRARGMCGSCCCCTGRVGVREFSLEPEPARCGPFVMGGDRGRVRCRGVSGFGGRVRGRAHGGGTVK